MVRGQNSGRINGVVICLCMLLSPLCFCALWQRRLRWGIYRAMSLVEVVGILFSLVLLTIGR